MAEIQEYFAEEFDKDSIDFVKAVKQLQDATNLLLTSTMLTEAAKYIASAPMHDKYKEIIVSVHDHLLSILEDNVRNDVNGSRKESSEKLRQVLKNIHDTVENVEKEKNNISKIWESMQEGK